jgi:hypothetical protein
VAGTSTTGIGVAGTSIGIGVFGVGVLAGGFFVGSVIATGAKFFKMDHPLDPENRYLMHACVESSEMKNLYDGVARLDEYGSAWIELPAWFEAVNGDFRYQLTAVGSAAPALHIAEELSGNRFKIAGGEKGIRVCWQVTGSRKDRWAVANPLTVESEKSEEERGRFLEPALYSAPEEQRVPIGPPPVEAMTEVQPPLEPSAIQLARLDEESLRQLDEATRMVEERRRKTGPSNSDIAGLEAQRLRQLDERRRLMEDQRRETDELRRRMEGPQEAPPENA